MRRTVGALSAAAMIVGGGVSGFAQTREAVRITDNVYMAVGAAVGAGGAAEATTVAVPQSNTFLVMTPAGNVIIDTSGPAAAAAHHAMLSAVSAAPVRAIVLTHGHGDHTGGVVRWRGPDTQLIAHRSFPEFLDYQRRLGGFFASRNAAQFGRGAGAALPADAANQARPAASAATALVPTQTFDDRLPLTIGGVAFEVLHTPGETPDHLTVWLPSARIAFIGDNYYQSFPNIYTLRGTRPRWALDYVTSIDRVLALDPEIVLPSHGQPIRGRDEIRRRLTRYRDAIQYVHDETVKGMNAGKDVFSLMSSVKLPTDLDIGESYGSVSWSVRGIYEGYAGWFDGNPSTMYGTQAAAYPDVVALAGGAARVAAKAREALASDPVRALFLTDIALAAEPDNRAALEARLAVLRALEQRSRNSNERGWVEAGIRDAQAKLKP